MINDWWWCIRPLTTYTSTGKKNIFEMLQGQSESKCEVYRVHLYLNARTVFSIIIYSCVLFHSIFIVATSTREPLSDPFNSFIGFTASHDNKP